MLTYLLEMLDDDNDDDYDDYYYVPRTSEWSGTEPRNTALTDGPSFRARTSATKYATFYSGYRS